VRPPSGWSRSWIACDNADLGEGSQTGAGGVSSPGPEGQSPTEAIGLLHSSSPLLGRWLDELVSWSGAPGSPWWGPHERRGPGSGSVGIENGSQQASMR
jgi:hypothetical protein